jgi:hypothetical protein
VWPRIAREERIHGGVGLTLLVKVDQGGEYQYDWYLVGVGAYNISYFFWYKMTFFLLADPSTFCIYVSLLIRF